MKWIWFLIIFVIILLIVINRKKIFGNKGGLIIGESHERGGINAKIRQGKWIELEGGEAIIDRNTMEITDRYICTGTPRDIASAINELRGGEKFGNGTCYKI